MTTTTITRAAGMTLAEAIGRKTKTLTPEQLSDIERGDCSKCGKPASESKSGIHGITCDHLGRIVAVECVECWNASVEEYRRERKAELAARPKCEACGRKPQTWTMHASDGPVSVCGTCRNKVNRVIRVPLLFGVPSASRARILEVARAS